MEEKHGTDGEQTTIRREAAQRLLSLHLTQRRQKSPAAGQRCKCPALGGSSLQEG